MKKLLSTLILISLILSLLISTPNVAAIDYIDDQGCSVGYPYTVESSENVFDNVSLGQTFAPTQNRLHLIFLDLMVNASDDDSVLTVAITDFNEETILASSNFNITAAMDGDMMLNVDFWDADWQPYDVPLTPGDTYKIKLTTTSGSGNLRWVYKDDADCLVGGAAIKGGVMDLTKDFGFGTRGYNYVAPVIVPEETPVVTPPVVTPTVTATVDTPKTTTVNTPTPTITDTTPTVAQVDDTKDTPTDENVELLEISTTEGNSKSTPSYNWTIIASVISALIIRLLVYMQIKFHLIGKFLKKKRK